MLSSIIALPFLIFYLVAWGLHPIGLLASIQQFIKKHKYQKIIKKRNRQNNLYKNINNDNKYHKVKENLSKTKLSVVEQSEKLFRYNKTKHPVNIPSNFMVNYEIDFNELALSQVESEQEISESQQHFSVEIDPSRASLISHKSVDLPHVDIIKPLKGVDLHLEKNLREGCLGF